MQHDAPRPRHTTQGKPRIKVHHEWTPLRANYLNQVFGCGGNEDFLQNLGCGFIPTM